MLNGYASNLTPPSASTVPSMAFTWFDLLVNLLFFLFQSHCKTRSHFPDSRAHSGLSSHASPSPSTARDTACPEAALRWTSDTRVPRACTGRTRPPPAQLSSPPSRPCQGWSGHLPPSQPSCPQQLFHEEMEGRSPGPGAPPCLHSVMARIEPASLQGLPEPVHPPSPGLFPSVFLFHPEVSIAPLLGHLPHMLLTESISFPSGDPYLLPSPQQPLS